MKLRMPMNLQRFGDGDQNSCCHMVLAQRDVFNMSCAAESWA